MSTRRGTVLLIHYKFPPVAAPSARRLGYLARQWQARGYRVLLITAHWPATDEPVGLAPVSGIERIEVPRRDLRSWWLGDRVTVPASVKSSPAGWRRWLLPRLLRAARSFPLVYGLGDGGPAYVRAVVRRAVPLIERDHVTHLFSSFGPWADHLAARRLKRRFPHLHWIADFRDLPVDPVAKDRYWPAVQWRFAAWVAQPADRVTTVSEGLVGAFAQCLPRVELIRQHLQCLPPALSTPHSRAFTITYTGTLYAGVQSPRLLFTVLRRLFGEGRLDPDRVRLRYVGRDRLLWDRLVTEHGLQTSNASRAFIPHEEVVALQRDSQLNLLLSWSSPTVRGILTTKLYEYLAAGRPILTLLHGPPDPELIELVEAPGAGRVFSDQIPSHADALRAWLLSLYTIWRSNDGRLPWSMDRDRLRPLLDPLPPDWPAG